MLARTALAEFESLSIPLKTKATRYETATGGFTQKGDWLLTRSHSFRATKNLTDGLTQSASARAPATPTLGGRTPNEVHFDRFPANRKPRFEPRDRWLRGSPCARPWALVRGKPGVRIELDVDFQSGRRHLPVVRLKGAA